MELSRRNFLKLTSGTVAALLFPKFSLNPEQKVEAQGEHTLPALVLESVDIDVDTNAVEMIRMAIDEVSAMPDVDGTYLLENGDMHHITDPLATEDVPIQLHVKTFETSLPAFAIPESLMELIPQGFTAVAIKTNAEFVLFDGEEPAFYNPDFPEGESEQFVPYLLEKITIQGQNNDALHIRRYIKRHRGINLQKSPVLVSDILYEDSGGTSLIASEEAIRIKNICFIESESISSDIHRLFNDSEVHNPFLPLNIFETDGTPQSSLDYKLLQALYLPHMMRPQDLDRIIELLTLKGDDFSLQLVNSLSQPFEIIYSEEQFIDSRDGRIIQKPEMEDIREFTIIKNTKGERSTDSVISRFYISLWEGSESASYGEEYMTDTTSTVLTSIVSTPDDLPVINVLQNEHTVPSPVLDLSNEVVLNILQTNSILPE